MKLRIETLELELRRSNYHAKITSERATESFHRLAARLSDRPKRNMISVKEEYGKRIEKAEKERSLRKEG
jgi:hypothetical protein